jgi:2-dehydro-3-deoxygluconokinase
MKTHTSNAVVVFGELLLRLDPPISERIVQADTFKARYTGAEANVAVSLANFGVPALVVSKVPEHEIGQACVNYLRRYGVNTDHIARGGERLGVLYVETGFSQRPSKVIYDRGASSIREVRPGEFDWLRILEGTRWFHFSGTAPALGSSVRSVVEEALGAARQLGVTTRCDSNYRSKLWPPEEAGRVLGGLLGRVDVVICGLEDAAKLFGIAAPAALAADAKACAEFAATRLRERFTCRHVAMTLRSGATASFNRYGGLLCGEEGCSFSREYEIQIVDRVGAGDAFTAGLIYQMACLKHTIPGDFNLVTVEEIERLIAGGDAGRVRR